MEFTPPRLVLVDGRRLAYEEVAPARPEGTVLLLCGLGAKRQGWSDLVALYAEALAEPDWDFPRAILHSAFELAFSPETKRIKACGNCGWLFIDRTRNGNKRWCIAEMCGSRTRSRRYYRRKTGAARSDK